MWFATANLTSWQLFQKSKWNSSNLVAQRAKLVPGIKSISHPFQNICFTGDVTLGNYHVKYPILGRLRGGKIRFARAKRIFRKVSLFGSAFSPGRPGVGLLRPVNRASSRSWQTFWNSSKGEPNKEKVPRRKNKIFLFFLGWERSDLNDMTPIVKPKWCLSSCLSRCGRCTRVHRWSRHHGGHGTFRANVAATAPLAGRIVLGSLRDALVSKNIFGPIKYDHKSW